MKIIDAHAHLIQCIAGTGASGEMRAIGNGKGMYADGSVCTLIPPFLGEYDVTQEALLKVMDENEVEKAVLLQGNYIGFQNLYSYEAVRKYPDRFLSAASYDPYSRNKDAIVRHLFEELRIPIVKFEVSTGSGLMSNHPTLPLDGDLLEKEFAYADEHGLILTIDIGKLKSESHQILPLKKAILRHPKMTWVVCHLLAPKQETLPELYEDLELLKLPNVWFDLAALSHNLRPDEPPFPVTRACIEKAVQILGADRLLFGTDMPSALTRTAYSDLVDCIAGDEMLSAAEKALILHDNAENVYFKHPVD